MDELKDIFGEKGVWVVLIGGVGLFALALLMGNRTSSGDTVMVTPTAYSSYPDAVTNANTIIDSVNNNTEYWAKQIMDSTNGYMEDGFTLLQENFTAEFDQIDSSLNDLTGSVGGVQAAVSGINTQLSTIRNGQTVNYYYSDNGGDDTPVNTKVINKTTGTAIKTVSTNGTNSVQAQTSGTPLKIISVTKKPVSTKKPASGSSQGGSSTTVSNLKGLASKDVSMK